MVIAKKSVTCKRCNENVEFTIDRDKLKASFSASGLTNLYGLHHYNERVLVITLDKNFNARDITCMDIQGQGDTTGFVPFNPRDELITSLIEERIKLQKKKLNLFFVEHVNLKYPYFFTLLKYFLPHIEKYDGYTRSATILTNMTFRQILFSNTKHLQKVVKNLDGLFFIIIDSISRDDVDYVEVLKTIVDNTDERDHVFTCFLFDHLTPKEEKAVFHEKISKFMLEHVEGKRAISLFLINVEDIDDFFKPLRIALTMQE